MLKSLTIASAAVLAFAAAPAMAQDAVGSFGVTYSDSSAELAGLKADGETWSLDGVTALPAFGEWTVTLAGAVSSVDFGAGDETVVNGSAGLSRVFGGDLRFGGFVGATDLDGDTAWTFGAQAQKYLAGATLTGLVAYTNIDDIDADVWTIGADAAIYATPNLRLNAGISYNDIDALGGSADAWSYGAGAEYQIGSSPFSVAGGYTRTEVSDLDLDVDTFRIGLRYSFGGGLQARDRAGAALPGSGVMGILGAL